MAILNDLLRSFQSMIGIKQATKKNVVGKKAAAPTKKSNGTLRKPTVRSRNTNGNGHRNGNGSNGKVYSKPSSRTRGSSKLAGSRKPFGAELATKILAPVQPTAGKPTRLSVAENAVAKPKGVLIGEITHYFSKIKVVVVKITAQSLKTSDKILIQGKNSAFTQTVKSLQIENKSVPSVKKGQLVGLKVSQAAKAGNKVYKI